MGVYVLGVYVWGVCVLESICPGGKCPGWYMSGEVLSCHHVTVLTSSALVNLVANWCKEYFRVLSVFFNRQLLVIFNICIRCFIISILDIPNYLCLGDINVL